MGRNKYKQNPMTNTRVLNISSEYDKGPSIYKKKKKTLQNLINSRYSSDLYLVLLRFTKLIGMYNEVYIFNFFIR